MNIDNPNKSVSLSTPPDSNALQKLVRQQPRPSTPAGWRGRGSDAFGWLHDDVHLRLLVARAKAWSQPATTATSMAARRPPSSVSQSTRTTINLLVQEQFTESGPDWPVGLFTILYKVLTGKQASFTIYIFILKRLQYILSSTMHECIDRDSVTLSCDIESLTWGPTSATQCHGECHGSNITESVSRVYALDGFT